ncbi:MAG: hypothetical protein AAGB12_06800 [Pseudomonadota bacterium]
MVSFALKTSKLHILLLVLLTTFSSLVNSAIFVIQNDDSPGEGFNDPTPVNPINGNTGQTLGQQRLQVFQRAGEIWGAVLDSSVEILVSAKFDDLECEANSAVLGTAGPTFVFRDESYLPLQETWYVSALANALAGEDQVVQGSQDAMTTGTDADMLATFNSGIDNNNNCLNNIDWYYGLDGNPPTQTVDLLSTLLHELGHGLGFLSLLDTVTGELFQGINDVFTRNLYAQNLGKSWSQITPIERAVSSVSNGELVWNGLNVATVASELQLGNSFGRPKLYTPSRLSSGSSVAHFDETLRPDVLMEPFQTVSFTDIDDMTKAAMQDLGWSLLNPLFDSDVELIVDLQVPKQIPINVDSTFNVSLSNKGSVEVSESTIRIELPIGVNVFTLPPNCTLVTQGIDCNFTSIQSGTTLSLSIPIMAQTPLEGLVTLTIISNHVELFSQNNFQTLPIEFIDEGLELSIAELVADLFDDSNEVRIRIDINNNSVVSAENVRLRIFDIADENLEVSEVPSGCQNLQIYIDCILPENIEALETETLEFTMAVIPNNATIDLSYWVASENVEVDLTNNLSRIRLSNIIENADDSLGDNGQEPVIAPTASASDGGSLNWLFFLLLTYLFCNRKPLLLKLR